MQQSVPPASFPPSSFSASRFIALILPDASSPKERYSNHAPPSTPPPSKTLPPFSLALSSLQLLTDVMLSISEAHASGSTSAASVQSNPGAQHNAGGGSNGDAEIHEAGREKSTDGAVDTNSGDGNALLCAAAALMLGGGGSDADLRQKAVELIIAIVTKEQTERRAEYAAPACLSDAKARLAGWLQEQVGL